MRKMSLEEIKETELNILVDFDKLCKENNLYYTLCGGTLLGAIRHKGFIPWDDDIDVLMPRPDYDRLLEKKDIDFSSLPNHLKICSWKDGTLKFPFIKLVDKRTKISTEFYDDDLNVNGIWIDVFPIDGNPNDSKETDKIYKKSLKLRKLIFLKIAKIGKGKNLFKRIAKPVVIKCLSVISSEKICEKIDELAKTYKFEDSEFIGGILWGYGPQEKIHKKGYMKPISVEFEKYFFNAPSNYDEYLIGLYKDYMELPPESQRICHEMTVFCTEE